MDKKQLLEWLKTNKASEDLIKFVEKLDEVNLNTVKTFLETNEDGKKYLKSHTDSSNTKAIDTFKEKTMPGLFEEEFKKRNPGETEEQKRIRLLEDDNKKFQDEVKRERLLNKAIAYATEKGYPTKHLGRFLGEDEEKTIANVEEFGANYLESIQKAVEEKFKAGGREGTPGGTPPGKDYSKMTDEEYFAERTKT